MSGRTMALMLDEAIVDAVALASLWRRDPVGWVGSDPDLRRVEVADLAYRPAVLEVVPEPGLHVLTGPRRAGKTVASISRVAGLLEAEYPASQIVRATLDDFSADDLRRLLTAREVHDRLGVEPDGARVWVLDEVTAVDGWQGVVLACQQGPLANDCVVLTGSRAPDMAPHAVRPNDATARWERLLPMSFRDVCRAAGDTVDLPALRVGQLLDHREVFEELHANHGEWLVDRFDEYVVSGGYPLAVASRLGRRGPVDPRQGRPTARGRVVGCGG